jgi:peptide/nickel transport system permease protein
MTTIPTAPAAPTTSTRASGPRAGRYISYRALLLLPAALIVAVGPWLWPLDPLEQVLTSRLQGPSWAHPLGTDNLGRDLLARVLHGGRITMGLAFLATVIVATVGIAVGLLAAWTRGVFDRVLLVVIDVLVAFPHLLLALTLAGLAGGGVRGLMLALTVAAWVPFARVARSEAMRLRATPMSEAATALGATPARVALRHVLPNAFPPIATLTVLRFSSALVTIAGLSFLGVGIAAPTPEWGAILRAALPFVERAPHIAIASGGAILGAALSVSIGAEGLRRMVDRLAR